MMEWTERKPPNRPETFKRDRDWQFGRLWDKAKFRAAFNEPIGRWDVVERSIKRMRLLGYIS
jgi:hypothetical protein